MPIRSSSLIWSILGIFGIYLGGEMLLNEPTQALRDGAPQAAFLQGPAGVMVIGISLFVCAAAVLSR